MSRLATALVIILGIIQTAFADDYKVDPVHTSIVFRIGHLDISHVYGRFNGATGVVQYDPAAPEKSSFDVQVEPKNIDTANPQRDKDLRSPNYFDAEKYQTIQFKSTSVKSAGGNAMEVTGDLTLNGTTKPLTVTIKHTGSGKDPWGGTRAGFETQFTINRTEWGMKSMPGVGDEVQLMIALECIKQQ